MPTGPGGDGDQLVIGCVGPISAEGVTGGAHPKMPPIPEFPVLPAVVVVTGRPTG